MTLYMLDIIIIENLIIIVNNYLKKYPADFCSN